MAMGIKCCFCPSVSPIFSWTQLLLNYWWEFNETLPQCLAWYVVVHEGGVSLLHVPFRSYGPLILPFTLVLIGIYLVNSYTTGGNLMKLYQDNLYFVYLITCWSKCDVGAPKNLAKTPSAKLFCYWPFQGGNSKVSIFLLIVCGVLFEIDILINTCSLFLSSISLRVEAVFSEFGDSWYAYFIFF